MAINKNCSKNMKQLYYCRGDPHCAIVLSLAKDVFQNRAQIEYLAINNHSIIKLLHLDFSICVFNQYFKGKKTPGDIWLHDVAAFNVWTECLTDVRQFLNHKLKHSNNVNQSLVRIKIHIRTFAWLFNVYFIKLPKLLSLNRLPIITVIP